MYFGVLNEKKNGEDDRFYKSTNRNHTKNDYLYYWLPTYKHPSHRPRLISVFDLPLLLAILM